MFYQNQRNSLQRFADEIYNSFLLCKPRFKYIVATNRAFPPAMEEDCSLRAFSWGGGGRGPQLDEGKTFTDSGITLIFVPYSARYSCNVIHHILMNWYLNANRLNLSAV